MSTIKNILLNKEKKQNIALLASLPSRINNHTKVMMRKLLASLCGYSVQTIVCVVPFSCYSKLFVQKCKILMYLPLVSP